MELLSTKFNSLLVLSFSFIQANICFFPVKNLHWFIFVFSLLDGGIKGCLLLTLDLCMFPMTALFFISHGLKPTEVILSTKSDF